MEHRPRPDANSDISNLLWMLRSENKTQYFTLVKMHLSFATDLSTDECDGKLDNTKSSSKWILTPLKRRFKSSTNNQKCVMDGVPLTQEGVCHAYQLINFLSRDENIKQEGIFRKTGSFSRQLELKQALNSGNSLNLERGPYSAHDCASVLKNFLAELPEPLLQEDHYHVHCKIADMCSTEMNLDADSLSNQRRVKALQLVFLLLPFANYQLLKDLLLLLHKVSQLELQNKMSARNLGTMFAPQILCPRKMTPNDMQTFSKILSTAVAFMIENANQLFKVPKELELDVRHYWRQRNNATTDEIDGFMKDAPTATSVTFVDKVLTAKANDDDVTKVALANLYAYVQALPESARKRKLVKQFNEASGKGTPMKGRIESKEPKMRLISDSIKRRLLNKSIKTKKKQRKELPSKRSISDDFLNNSNCCSPELKLFRRMSPKSSSKSLDDLTHMDSKVSPPYHIRDTLTMYDTPIRKTRTADTSREFISTPELGLYGTVSLSDNSISSYSASDLLTPCNKTSHQASSKFASGVYSLSEDSPISRAVLNSNIQQKDIMTPRSRCPIIVNSSPTLPSVYMKETHQQQDLSEKVPFPEVCKENCPKISNEDDISKTDGKTCSLSSDSSNSGFSNYHSVSSNNDCNSSNSSSDYRSIASSATSLSLFEGFFDKLSTSSLIKLSSKLSVSSLKSEHNSPASEFAGSQSYENQMTNDSLSSVFQDYLDNRSSASISMSKGDCILSEDKIKEISMGNLSPPQVTSLSDSLLYCLDGNNPLHNSESSSNGVCLPAEVLEPSESPTHSSGESLRSCSPNGRNKLFRNKHGTPIPILKQESTSNSDSTSVIFETSF